MDRAEVYLKLSESNSKLSKYYWNHFGALSREVAKSGAQGAELSRGRIRMQLNLQLN